MIKSAISRWDAVDIKFARGDKRFGYVVDIQGNNVLVDCGNGIITVSHQNVLPPPERDRDSAFCELIADQIRDSKSRGQPDSWNKYDMEVVLQLSPQEPFRWFPARPLRLLHPDYRLMEVQLSNQRIRCVLPSDHFRRADRVECGNVLQVIVKERIRVPADFVLSDTARRLWRQQFYRSKIADVRDGFLYYLRKNEKWRNDSEAKMEKFLKEITNRSKAEATTLSNKPASLPGIHEVLPAEVMLKIFKLLDTEHQACARRVCRQWNMWLHLPQIVSVVRIDCWEEFELDKFVVTSDRDPEQDRGRKVAACLFHCLGPNTRKLVLTGFKMWQVLGRFESMKNFLAIQRLPEVVLAGMEEDFDGSHLLGDWRQPENVFEIHPTLRRICQWLTLDNVTIKDINCSFAFAGDQWHELDQPEILDIKGVSARINLQSPGCAGDLWNAMEKCYPVVSVESRMLIEHALHMAGKADCQSTEEREKWALIGKMLCEFETSDPRNQHLPIRKFEEPVNWSSVRLESLNKMTMFILNYFLTDCHGSDKDRSNPDQSSIGQTDDKNDGEQDDDVEPDAKRRKTCGSC